ncbi:MAG: J domain-containing protein [Cyanobacteriota bacterium]
MLSSTTTVTQRYQNTFNNNSQQRVNTPVDSNNVYYRFEHFLNTQTGKQSKDEIIITNPADKSNDGKFSLTEAAKNFLKGLISPVTSLFKSIKNFVIGSAMIAVGVALCAFGMGPALVALGVVLGALQGAKSIYKMVTAKNGDGVEKAFFDAGSATATLSLSIMGAKSALRSAGIETTKMLHRNAVVNCFKQASPAISKGTSSIKAAFIKPQSEAIANATRINNAPKVEMLNSSKTITNPYKILGIKKNASNQQIKEAYRKLASLFHPDKKRIDDAGTYFREVSEAYHLISDAAKKPDIDLAVGAESLLQTPITLIPQAVKRIID